ncbi:MAG TPA: adenylate/guanylate cyclase domain-containing protein, partial [Anaerolineaceae bacterium]|nr:adenylate/guanylate cyclase domain-containing protein [Anaerolineaceae bacterium]
TASETTFYDSNGQALASTIYTAQETSPLTSEQVNQIMAAQDKSSLSRNLSVNQFEYAEILGPWDARDNVNLGIAGTALPQSYLLRTSNITQVEIFVLVGTAILLVVAVGLFIASRITRPLVRLANASSQVAQGNLEVKVDSQGDDEVAVLAHSFNYMIAGLQEGSVYRDLLGRTVSPEVREQLRQTFEAGNLRLAGQQSIATVLMTDIRGFTSISELADPATVLTWLNEYFGRLVPIITAHGGVVNKFDGDAMLAFFGILPKRLTPKQGAFSACKAALEIMQSVDELNVQRLEREEPALITGIGINTGVVIAGGLGSSDRLHYTIIGDTVNTAQRLESLTRQVYASSGILVGQATTLALGEFGSDFQLYPAGSFAVKGKSDQIKVFRLAPAETRVPEVML